jgi:hypothetical protein
MVLNFGSFSCLSGVGVFDIAVDESIALCLQLSQTVTLQADNLTNWFPAGLKYDTGLAVFG